MSMKLTSFKIKDREISRFNLTYYFLRSYKRHEEHHPPPPPYCRGRQYKIKDVESVKGDGSDSTWLELSLFFFNQAL